MGHSKDPDFIFMDLMKGFDSGPGKTEDDLRLFWTSTSMIVLRDGFKNLTAVQNNHVYLIDSIDHWAQMDYWACFLCQVAASGSI